MGALKLFDAALGEVVAEKRFPRAGGALAFSADSRRLAITIGERSFGPDSRTSIRVLDSRTGELISRSRTGRNRITALAFSSDDDQLWSVSESAELRKWRVESRRLAEKQVLRTERVALAAISSSSGRLVTSSGLGGVQVWDLGEGELLRVIDTVGVPAGVSALAISQDGTLLAIGMDSRTLSVHEVSSGRLVREVRDLVASVSALAFSRDGQHLVSGLRNGTAVTWRVAELRR